MTVFRGLQLPNYTDKILYQARIALQPHPATEVVVEIYLIRITVVSNNISASTLR